MGSACQAKQLDRIRVSDDGRSFVAGAGAHPWKAWGANYDHDEPGRLIEDYWSDEWNKVEEDFREMHEMGFNVVRVHLQLGRFMKSANEPNEQSLAKLKDLLELATRNDLYLDLTGLGCYHKQDTPSWYDNLSEADRWDVQARFWKAIAKTCQNSSTVFCYDLMNEPVVAGGKPEKDWLLGELGGKFFVQRISLDLAGRTRDEVVGAWIRKLTGAIRSEDTSTLITVGEIPWATVFRGAKSTFHSDTVGKELDFVSVHFYPKSGEMEKTLESLAVYEIGKPLVIEEIFPLGCSQAEADQFIKQTSDRVDGVISFYWGATIAEYKTKETIQAAIISGWLEYLQANAPKRQKP